VAPDAGALQDTLVPQFERSASAWNRGNLEAFVGDYSRDSLTAFVSGGHVQYGFDRIRDGRTTASGPFTLVMERRPDGWKILHDHTSSN
jgi:ketosteroid isomerase-like protein